MMKPNPIKLVVAILASLYFLWCAYDPFTWKLLDGVDLAIHEAGHPIFHIFGEFIGVAGGSLAQVLMPLSFFGYFLYRGQYYSASFVLFWVGQSTLNVFVYANDAVVMQLPLLSGMTGSEGSFHDWNYLLDSTGLLGYTKQVAGLIRFAGTAMIIAAIAGTIYFSSQNERMFDYDE
jgi:hypothetical protein